MADILAGLAGKHPAMLMRRTQRIRAAKFASFLILASSA
jgi:hypothetical protein